MFHRIHFGGKPALLLLCSVLLAAMLWGCGNEPAAPSTAGSSAAAGTSSTGVTGESTGSTVATVPTEPTEAPTIPADSNANNATCQGSYTVDDPAASADTEVARIDNISLTNGKLQVYYWMEVAAWQHGNHEVSPNFDKPLDSQRCSLDSTVITWQQYFLKRALNTWHTAQALTLRGENEAPPLEEAYQPNLENHEEYMVGMPALDDLYGYRKSFIPNELHQQHLDSLAETFSAMAADRYFGNVDAMIQDLAGAGASAEDLMSYAEIYNRGYMYFTELGYNITATEEEITACFEENKDVFAQQGITADSGKYADIRHILVVPEGTTYSDGKIFASDKQWDAAFKTVQSIEWQYKSALIKNPSLAHPRSANALFAEIANQRSQDTGTALDGGLYQKIRKGQLIDELDQWVFADERQDEDYAIIQSGYGYHIIFLWKTEEIWHAEAKAMVLAEKMAKEITDARQKYPMTVDFSAISLGNAERTADAVTPSDILYADIAHERYPTVPLYLQQDYPDTMYGSFKITSHGCGITTLAMLASYMTDTEQTPPEMCALYGEYSYVTGTDGIMFNNVPAEMGFYLIKKSHNDNEVKQAMLDGRLVVCVQNKGYWTRGGHYLVLEEMFEDETIRVRDSNIFNYGRLERHKDDLFPWTTIPGACGGYWIFQDKITAIPACSRCGTQDHGTSIVTDSYLCEKCTPALFRRNLYMNGCGLDY